MDNTENNYLYKVNFMLLEDYHNIKVRKDNFDYFISKGYNCKLNEYIGVKSSDLQKGSNRKVRYLCDSCKKEIKISYCDYTKRKRISNKDLCIHCKGEETEKSNLKKYGVKNVMGIEENKIKLAKTNIEKYGCECVFQNEDIKNKIKDTLVKKYGCDNPIKCASIKEKIEKTNIKRYGVKIPMFLNLNEEKRKETNLKRYGNEYSIASDFVKKKIRESFFNNGSVKTSKQQKYVCELYGGILNYPIDICNLDMFFPEYNIYCEWDGGGHNISKYYGKSEEELRKREIRRAYYLKTKGLKEFRIISSKDYVPTDEILLNMKKIAFDILLNMDLSWVRFDIESGFYFYKDNKIEYKYR